MANDDTPMAENPPAEPAKRRRGPGRPFAKGKSPNPGGRPKAVAHVIALAQEHTDLAVDTLAEICRDKLADPRARITAAEALLSRGYGKSVENVDVTSKGEKLESPQATVFSFGQGAEVKFQ
jgi:hypothetical protein